MKRKNTITSDNKQQEISDKEKFLAELDQKQQKDVVGGMWGTCMNGCGGRCGGCNCSPAASSCSSGGWW